MLKTVASIHEEVEQQQRGHGGNRILCGRIVTRMGEDRVRASFASAKRAVRRRRTAQPCQRLSITKMNRRSLNDSKLWLDGVPQKHDHTSMITQPYRLYAERTDASKNMARFYSMAIEPNLFGEACLTRCWGRIGTRGQTMCHHFASEREAVVLFLDLLRQKRRRGYSAVVHGPPTHDGYLFIEFGHRHENWVS